MSLSVNGKKLKPGEDFLIDPGSPGVSGKFSVEILTAEDLLSSDGWIKKIKNGPSKFVVVNAVDKSKYSAEQLKHIDEVISFLKYSNDNPAKGTLILTTEKLTWSGSRELFSKPCFTIKTSALSDPITSVEVSAENKFLKNHQTQNVIGYLEGTKKDSLLVLTAHYDHLGMMGTKPCFPAQMTMPAAFHCS